jgi:hypothetical protein
MRMKHVFVFLLLLGPVFSFARTVVGRDTLQLPSVLKMVSDRDSPGYLQPDHMPCRYPQLALVERMPILLSVNADRMPNGFRYKSPLRFNGLVVPGP